VLQQFASASRLKRTELQWPSATETLHYLQYGKEALSENETGFRPNALTPDFSFTLNE